MATKTVPQYIEMFRKEWLKNAKTPLQEKFGTDPEVKWFIREYYNYMRANDRHAPRINELDYYQWAYFIVDKNSYEIAKEELEFDDEKQLYKLMDKLRQKYWRMKL